MISWSILQDRPLSDPVTETVYRHVIVPAIQGGASVMDDVFGLESRAG
jgi:hypothetical protein